MTSVQRFVGRHCNHQSMKVSFLSIMWFYIVLRHGPGAWSKIPAIQVKPTKIEILVGWQPCCSLESEGGGEAVRNSLGPERAIHSWMRLKNHGESSRSSPGLCCDMRSSRRSNLIRECHHWSEKRAPESINRDYYRRRRTLPAVNTGRIRTAIIVPEFDKRLCVTQDLLFDWRNGMDSCVLIYQARWESGIGRV
ncbi:hypothetical protein AG1IA_04744 [Rhizoctonia solani AG-1 IA]|uniref:Uncharacterized protein n=1 Tax=Thanatephorus cucumeris (strain AG1-IA) TaxID=983506 RepID=L8WWQ7_THACA|nr:hypothetical protein AG1IA_04744 [Rhizoctonia solani AG-1 IA]